jgi:hypothetical protein
MLGRPVVNLMIAYLGGTTWLPATWVPRKLGLMIHVGAYVGLGARPFIYFSPV